MTIFAFDEGSTSTLVHAGSGTAGLGIMKNGNRRESLEPVRPSARAVDGLRTLAASPPVRIASQSPARFNSITVEDTAEPVKLDLEKVRKRAAKKKRRNQAKGPAAPAVQTIRGFHTPAGSGGEESASDFSVASTPRMGPRRDFSSVTSSPAMRPMTPSGISALKLRLDALSIGNRSPYATPALRRELSSTGSDASDSDKTEMDVYEVPLEEDFVSPDVRSKSFMGAVEGGIKRDAMVRKMAAEDFEPLKCLGKGSFGTVHLVKQRGTGRLFAQKQFKKASLVVHKRLVEQTKTERQILESVNRHPFVVKLFYAFQDHEKLYLILEYAQGEYAQGGELFHHLKMERMFDEPTAAFYMAEMILALEHLHRNLGVVYRDLKPENCLLDAEGHLLLTDFGLSKVSVDDDARCNSFLGTVDYMAPEIVAGKEYSFAVDWWSLGALAFDLLTGKPPFGGNNNAKIEQAIVHKKLAMPYFLGPNAKDLLTRLLRKEPHKRLGYNMPKDLTIMKTHQFFKTIDWKRLARREVEPPIRPLITDPELAENFDEEFTDLAVSPVLSRKSFADALEEAIDDQQANPFGGFSFVASQSLLEAEDFLL